MRLGDLNGDGIVDVTDEDILKQDWGDCPCCAVDLDGDGTVGDLDLLILLADWG